MLVFAGNRLRVVSDAAASMKFPTALLGRRPSAVLGCWSHVQIMSPRLFASRAKNGEVRVESRDEKSARRLITSPRPNAAKPSPPVFGIASTFSSVPFVAQTLRLSPPGPPAVRLRVAAGLPRVDQFCGEGLAVPHGFRSGGPSRIAQPYQAVCINCQARSRLPHARAMVGPGSSPECGAVLL